MYPRLKKVDVVVIVVVVVVIVVLSVDIELKTSNFKAYVPLFLFCGL